MDRHRNSLFNIHRRKFLATTDAEAMVGLVARACDPGTDATIGERRHELCRGLAELVDADVWISVVGVSPSNDPSDSAPLGIYDGGWRDERQRVEAFGACMEKEMSRIVNDVTSSAFASQRTLTYLREQAISDSVWYASPLGKTWNHLGLDQFMISIYPMPDYYHSVIGLHRFSGREPFDDRDRTVLHVVWQQTEWLHRRDLDLPVGNKVIDLTVRERQVLVLMLGGESRKTAAQKMALSEHTVGDYIKSIYKKLEVRSRTELMTRFMPGRS